MYFWIVRLLTRIPSFISSPRMRSAPQSTLLAAIAWRSSTTSRASRFAGLFGRELRWHRDLFKIVWRRKSRPNRPANRLAREVIELIQSMAANNVLRGAERIRGELLKLGIRVSKRTMQKYMRVVRPHRRCGQNWSTWSATIKTFG